MFQCEYKQWMIRWNVWTTIRAKVSLCCFECWLSCWLLKYMNGLCMDRSVGPPTLHPHNDNVVRVAQRHVCVFKDT